MTQTPLHNKTDLSYINTLKDLRKEIVRVKAEVKTQEKEIIDRFKKVPKETAFVAVRSVIPLIATRGVPTRVFNLITNGIGLYRSEKEIIDRFKKVPKETAFVAVRSVIPLIATRGVPTRVFNLITNGIGLFISIRKQRR